MERTMRSYMRILLVFWVYWIGIESWKPVIRPLVHSNQALRPKGEICEIMNSPAEPVFRPSRRMVTSFISSVALLGSMVVGSAQAEENAVSRTDVGLISIGKDQPRITDICWMDLKIGDAEETKRIEISLYGEVVPKTVENFKALCSNSQGYGYKGSSIFRVISGFSLQGGNIGQPSDALPSQLNKFGKSAVDKGAGFAPENYRIQHDFPAGGVVSMMKDITRRGLQDSRFFITTSSSAGWADDKYSAFGRVTSGLGVLGEIENIPVKPPSNCPLTPVTIVDSGLKDNTQP